MGTPPPYHYVVNIVRCQLLVVSPLGWTQIRSQTGCTLLSGTTGLHGRGLLTLSISSRGVAPPHEATRTPHRTPPHRRRGVLPPV